jgi:hypothetical protein
MDGASLAEENIAGYTLRKISRGFCFPARRAGSQEASTEQPIVKSMMAKTVIQSMIMGISSR